MKSKDRENEIWFNFKKQEFMWSQPLFSLYCVLLFVRPPTTHQSLNYQHRNSKSSTSTRPLITPPLHQKSTSLHRIMVHTLRCIPLSKSKCAEFQNFEMKQSPLISLLVHHWPWITVNSQFHHFVRTGEFFFQSSKTNDMMWLLFNWNQHALPSHTQKSKERQLLRCCTQTILLFTVHFLSRVFFVDPFCVYESGEVLDYRRLKLKRIPLIWLKCLGNRSKGT